MFVLPLFVDVFNWNGIARRNGMIGPHFTRYFFSDRMKNEND